MPDHFGTLCIKGLKAVITSNSLISGGLDNDRIVYFIFCRKILQIYWQRYVWKFYQHILSKIPTNSKNIPPPPHILWWHTLALALLQSLPYFFFLCWSASSYLCMVFYSISSNMVRFSQSIHLLMCCCWFFNWDSLHARLNSHYKAWSYKKKKHKKIKAYRKSV